MSSSGTKVLRSPSFLRWSPSLPSSHHDSEQLSRMHCPGFGGGGRADKAAAPHRAGPLRDVVQVPAAPPQELGAAELAAPRALGRHVGVEVRAARRVGLEGR